MAAIKENKRLKRNKKKDEQKTIVQNRKKGTANTNKNLIDILISFPLPLPAAFNAPNTLCNPS